VANTATVSMFTNTGTSIQTHKLPIKLGFSNCQGSMIFKLGMKSVKLKCGIQLRAVLPQYNYGS